MRPGHWFLRFPRSWLHPLSLWVLVTTPSSHFRTRSNQDVLLFLIPGLLYYALWFSCLTHIFVNITLSKISICLIFTCHLFLAGLKVTQARRLPTPASPCLLSSSHTDPSRSAHSLSVSAWNILPPDLCTSGLHSHKYQLHRKAFSDVLSLGSPLPPRLLINFYVLFS